MASRDIFGFTDTKWGGTFWDRNALFEVGSGHISLIQDYSIQYAQNIQPLYEVGSDTVYFSKSHQAGTLSINRVLSDDDVIAFWGDGCEVKDATIQTANGICGGSGSTGDATATQSTNTYKHNTSKCNLVRPCTTGICKRRFTGAVCRPPA
jgi:hypothetical protein